jgi:flavin reductase (DIM6/NTAB) family NADH-FMN oxidoreductase RutF
VKSFARGGTPESFAGHALVENVFGSPQFAEAWAFLACQVRGSIPAGDHVLYVAEVLDGALQHEGDEPMTRTRRDGFGY